MVLFDIVILRFLLANLYGMLFLFEKREIVQVVEGHMTDVARVIEIIHLLHRQGHVLVCESGHLLDQIIDMGPYRVLYCPTNASQYLRKDS